MNYLSKEYGPWLASVKVGDMVCITGHSSIEGAYVCQVFKVTRLTKTQIICETRQGEEDRFNRERGYQVGQTYGAHIEPLTEELKTGMRRRRKINEARDYVEYLNVANNWRLLSEEQINALAATLKTAYETVKATESTNEVTE